jgi:hypothetical protein
VTTSPIRGKVARILTSRELVINVGAKDGVTEGMYFDVMDPKGDDITDPDTGEMLGSIGRPKVRVQVTAVQERLSVAATFKKKQVNVGGHGSSLAIAAGGLAELLTPPKWVTKYETLKTNEKTWEDLEEKESFVKTGDPVVQVITPQSESAGSAEEAVAAVAGSLDPKKT